MSSTVLIAVEAVDDGQSPEVVALVIFLLCTTGSPWLNKQTAWLPNCTSVWRRVSPVDTVAWELT
jgi:hypothetical protein